MFTQFKITAIVNVTDDEVMKIYDLTSENEITDIMREDAAEIRVLKGDFVTYDIEKC